MFSINQNNSTKNVKYKTRDKLKILCVFNIVYLIILYSKLGHLVTSVCLLPIFIMHAFDIISTQNDTRPHIDLL